MSVLDTFYLVYKANTKDAEKSLSDLEKASERAKKKAISDGQAILDKNSKAFEKATKQAKKYIEENSNSLFNMINRSSKTVEAQLHRLQSIIGKMTKHHGSTGMFGKIPNMPGSGAEGIEVMGFGAGGPIAAIIAGAVSALSAAVGTGISQAIQNAQQSYTAPRTMAATLLSPRQLQAMPFEAANLGVNPETLQNAYAGFASYRKTITDMVALGRVSGNLHNMMIYNKELQNAVKLGLLDGEGNLFDPRRGFKNAMNSLSRLDKLEPEFGQQLASQLGIDPTIVERFAKVGENYDKLTQAQEKQIKINQENLEAGEKLAKSQAELGIAISSFKQKLAQLVDGPFDKFIQLITNVVATSSEYIPSPSKFSAGAARKEADIHENPMKYGPLGYVFKAIVDKTGVLRDSVKPAPKSIQKTEIKGKEESFKELAAGVDARIQKQFPNWKSGTTLKQWMVESSLNPKAVSPAGAKGLAQILPSNYGWLGITDPFDPNQSAAGYEKYMLSSLKRYKGDVSAAIADYHAGQGNMKKYLQGEPSGVGKQTMGYVSSILGQEGVNRLASLQGTGNQLLSDIAERTTIGNRTADKQLSVSEVTQQNIQQLAAPSMDQALSMLAAQAGMMAGLKPEKGYEGKTFHEYGRAARKWQGMVNTTPNMLYENNIGPTLPKTPLGIFNKPNAINTANSYVGDVNMTVQQGADPDEIAAAISNHMFDKMQGVVNMFSNGNVS